MSLYDDLGLSPDATADQIKAAHRAAAKRHHPDTGGDREAFDRAQRAAMVLRDPEKRARYDQTGATDDRPDNALSEVTNLLCSTFTQALEQCDFERQDIVQVTKTLLSRKLAEMRTNVAGCTQARDVLIKARGRLGHKGERPNLIDGLLDQQIKQHDQALAEMARVEGLIQQAIDFADDYSWRVDEMPVMQPFSFTTTSSSSTWGAP